MTETIIGRSRAALLSIFMGSLPACTARPSQFPSTRAQERNCCRRRRAQGRSPAHHSITSWAPISQATPTKSAARIAANLCSARCCATARPPEATDCGSLACGQRKAPPVRAAPGQRPPGIGTAGKESRSSPSVPYRRFRHLQASTTERLACLRKRGCARSPCSMGGAPWGNTTSPS
jgi:hypothetical protein